MPPFQRPRVSNFLSEHNLNLSWYPYKLCLNWTLTPKRRRSSFLKFYLIYRPSCPPNFLCHAMWMLNTVKRFILALPWKTYIALLLRRFQKCIENINFVARIQDDVDMGIPCSKNSLTGCRSSKRSNCKVCV